VGPGYSYFLVTIEFLFQDADGTLIFHFPIAGGPRYDRPLKETFLVHIMNCLSLTIHITHFMVDKLIVDFTEFNRLKPNERHHFVMTNNVGGMSCSGTEIVLSGIFQRPIYGIVIGANEEDKNAVLQRFRTQVPWGEFEDMVNI
jgi:hypothetical protein